MKTNFYAQLNEEGVCFCVTQLGDTVEANEKMVKLAYMDESVLDKRWDGNEWHEVPKPEPVVEDETIPEPEPEEEDETIPEEELEQESEADPENEPNTEDEPVDSELLEQS